MPRAIKEGAKPGGLKRKTEERKAEFIAAYPKHLGIISATCAKIGISRETYRDWVNKDKAFAAAVRQAEIECHEIVESKLASLIQKEHPTAIIFYLKTRYPEKWKEVYKVEGFLQLDALRKDAQAYIDQLTSADGPDDLKRHLLPDAPGSGQQG